VGDLVNENEFIPSTETRKTATKILAEERNLPAGEKDQNLIQTLTELSGETAIPAQFCWVIGYRKRRNNISNS